MKKIVGTIAAIALAASSAFAGVNVGMGFSRGFFTPIAYDGKDARADISTSWGAQPRIGASISAASDDCGVVADIKFDGGAVNVNDNAYIWVKPTSWLKMQIGQSFDDTLRGNACFGSWDWLRFGNITGEDFVFTRVCGNPTTGAYAPLVGAILMLDPIEGLHISVGLPMGANGYAKNPDGSDKYFDDKGNSTWGFTNSYDNTKWEDLIKHIQIQAGYTIADVMQIKAQWIGFEAEDPINHKGDSKGIIEVAVGLKAVENMTLDVGVKFSTVEKAPITVNAYWAMPFGSVNVNALAGVTLPTTDVDAAKVTTVTVGAGVGFDLGNGLSFDADVRYQQNFGDKDKLPASVSTDATLGFGAYLNKGIANGGLGIGFEGASKTAIRDFNADDFTFAVPVRVQCFF